jgi:nitrogen-specific signal transduction histidine kinase
MSIAEMKLIAFEKLVLLKEEKALKEILEHIDALAENEKGKTYNLSRHFDAIDARYGETLKKLAQ